MKYISSCKFNIGLVLSEEKITVKVEKCVAVFVRHIYSKVEWQS